MLLLVAGVPGSGKTYFADRLARAIGAVHCNTDSVRTELGLRGRYDLATKQRVYEALLDRARTALLAGQTVIVDATFHRADRRQAYYELAEELSIPLKIVEIRVEEAIALARVSQSRSDSEAGPAVYRRIRAAFEPIERPHRTLWSTNHNIDTLLWIAQYYLEH
jgi:predicted kinase